MFEILNGREHFFQWDLEQKIIVNDATINEVHFSNKTDESSLVCVVEEYEGKRVANVPNILLQTDWAIHVYAYCTNYTKVEEVFKVIPRSFNNFLKLCVSPGVILSKLFPYVASGLVTA